MRDGKLQALVVDDNPVNRRLAVSLLERLSFRTDASACGKDALLFMASHNYDVILMDCQMPVMDGLTATKVLRRHEESVGAHALVVGVTAHETRQNCLNAGMDDHIEKPLTMRLLTAVLTKHMPELSGPGT